MKEKYISNKSFIKNAKNFEKRVHKYINGLYSDCQATQERMHSHLKYHVSEMINKLILSYKQNPYRKMSGFVHKIKMFEDSNDIMNEIKIWYEFEYDNGNVIFKYSEKYPTFYNRKFKRKVQLVLKYSDIPKEYIFLKYIKTKSEYIPSEYDFGIIKDAIMRGDINFIKKLIDNGLDINKDYSNFNYNLKSSLLNLSIQFNQFDIAKFLIDNGADVNEQQNVYRYSPLHTISVIIAFTRETNITQDFIEKVHNMLSYLINNGADMSLKNDMGKTFIEHITNVKGYTKNDLIEYLTKKHPNEYKNYLRKNEVNKFKI